MLPNLILSWITIAGMALGLVLLPILGLAGAAILKEYIPNTDQDDKESALAFGVVIFIFWIMLAIVFGKKRIVLRSSKE